MYIWRHKTFLHTFNLSRVTNARFVKNIRKDFTWKRLFTVKS